MNICPNCLSDMFDNFCDICGYIAIIENNNAFLNGRGK